MDQFPYELISNLASIILLAILGYKYLQYKKNIDVLQGLDELKKQNKLTEEDIDYISSNEYEYKHKVIAGEANTKIARPIFILLAGVVIIFFPLNEAFIHLNVVVVAFIFMTVDQIHKKNLYNNLYALKKEIKREKKEEEEKEEA